MMSKNKILLSVLLALCVTATALAAPEKSFRVEGDELEYDVNSGYGTAKGNVVIQHDGGKATADSARFNSKEKSGVLSGNVVADKEDMHIVCNEFVVRNGNDMTAIGDAVLTKGGRTLSADRVNYYRERGFMETEGEWAKLVDTDGSILNAGKIDYDINQGVANAYGNVQIQSDARKLTATSDSAIYKTDNNNGYVELRGHAYAIQDGNSVAGDKLRLTNKDVGVADGHVKMLYLPESKPADETTQETEDTMIVGKGARSSIVMGTQEVTEIDTTAKGEDALAEGEPGETTVTTGELELAAQEKLARIEALEAEAMKESEAAKAKEGASEE